MKTLVLAALSFMFVATAIGSSRAASIADLKSVVEGVYILDEWTIDGRTFRPPEVEGRSVFLNGNVITVLIDTTKEAKKTYDTLLGVYSQTTDFFTYQYISRTAFTQSPDNISLSRALPFDGKSRDFAVSQVENSVHMQYQDKSSLDFTPEGLVYSVAGKVVRVWHRAKPE
jgi:hypothetical protein